MRKSLSSNHRQPRWFRPQLECLEDRSVPATFYVNTTVDVVDPADRKLSLREAITKANTRPGADVIVLPAGVFNITRGGASEDANSTGDFDITDSVTIAGAGRNLTFIDGQQGDRVFQVAGTSPGSIGVVLARMTVRNGKVDAPGGGVAVTNANLLVRDAAVTGNQATGVQGNGGGIFADSAATIKLVRSIVARNVAGNFGGGIDASLATLIGSVVQRNIAVNGGGLGASTATLTNSTVSGNSASDTGGGIFVFGTATLINCTVSGNSADGIGGVLANGSATLTNCTVSGNAASNDGGGIGTTTATLTNCTVYGNTAGRNGGGIYAIGTATLTNCKVGGNSADSIGGGIFAASMATLTHSTVSGNSADFGGGINAETATLTNCTVSGNAASNDGGGINASTATLTNSTVSGNSTDGVGGGIRTGTATLTKSTVSGNTAGTDGGGIFATGTATLTDCTVSGNSAGSKGGGIYAEKATLTNCTVADNLADFGAGLYRSNIGGAFNLRNTIVALNLVRPGGTGPDVAGDAFTSQGHNLIGIGNASFSNGAIGDLVGTSLNPIDPLLGPLANNGGPTQTHKLLAGSPAIDAGDNLFEELTDQRGRSRRRDGNGDGRRFIDIGAFER